MTKRILSSRTLIGAPLAFLLFSLVSAAFPAEPPAEPILRIDAGEHTALIRHIATDEAGRWLVTASQDKTARVWDLVTGRLLNTLRPPVGAGNEGFLFAVALSPDGQIVALGGSTQFNDGKMSLASEGHSITLHDRASGRLLRRISGLPSANYFLAFSSDGRYLAATFAGKTGVSVFSSADGRLLAEDHDYGDFCVSAHFSPDGRLVTTSYDGFLRLYRFDGERLTLLTKQAATGGKQPSARFSPDGQRIAVGFNDTPAVDLFDGRDLRFLFALDTTGVIGNLGSVAWTRDGTSLYAAGTARRNGQHFIRRWPVQGVRSGPLQDWSVAGSTIADITPLPNGRLAFASGEPAWGVVSAGGERSLFHVAVVADFGGVNQEFTLSSDGARVRFGYQRSGKSPVVFDSRNRMLLPADTPGLAVPVLAGAGINVADWNNTFAPKLNGTLLKLYPYERSYSLALRPADAGFVLGTVSNLRAFDRQGQPVWQQPAPGAVWGVNVSQDGRWVVAAYADGTIRWHRATDGAEQLAFFPHADKRRWVLWSPTGYYDASPGAEDLIGWHLNRGRDSVADFFPASRFRVQFHRPDVLAKVLDTMDEKKAIELANAETGRVTQAVTIAQVLPPVVEIISPNEGTSISSVSVTVRYRTRTPGDAPVTGLRIRVNGQAVSLPDTRTLAVVAALGGEAREVTIPIPPQDSEIQLFAENKNGVSTPAVLRVSWAGAKPVAKEDVQYKPKLYVLAVGVSKYANPDYDLGLAAKDAKDFAAVFQKQKGQLYADVQVRLLTDTKATKDDVLDGLEWLKRQVTARDVGVMFLAGHGMNDNTGKYYFMPHNADPSQLLRTGVAQTDIKDTLNILAGKAVFFVDTCHSGNALGTGRTRSMASPTDAFVNELASAENGVVVFTAATGRQLSQENEDWGNGAFTKAVVEGLSGKADFQKTGRITHKALDYYVAERVKELTKGGQSPVSIAPQGVTDFPIAVAQ